MTATGIRSIHVHVDDNETASIARVRLAAELADRMGAALTGLAAAQPFVPAYAPFAEELVLMQPAVYQAAEQLVASALEKAEALFRKATSGTAEWCEANGKDAIDFLSSMAAEADLIIAGNELANARAGSLRISVSDLLMTVGRPVLIAPPGVEHLSARVIVVGWKNTAESRRAIQDALPLLARAGEVIVVGVGEETPLHRLAPVVTYLTRHGVAAKALAEPQDGESVSDVLLKVSRRVDADLIVAGAFGHSRLREWALGGVTRDMIAEMPVCCLLSR